MRRRRKSRCDIDSGAVEAKRKGAYYYVFGEE